MPDVDLLVWWEVDSGLSGEEPVDLALRAKFRGEWTSKNIDFGKRIIGLTSNFGGIHLDNKNNKLKLPTKLKQIIINGILLESIELIIGWPSFTQGDPSWYLIKVSNTVR